MSADAEEAEEPFLTTNNNNNIPPHNHPHPHPQHPQPTSFTAQWATHYTTNLLPTALPLSRVPRAWERKPLSPLAKKKRNKFRVGKVWKRRGGVVPLLLSSRERLELGEEEEEEEEDD